MLIIVAVICIPLMSLGQHNTATNSGELTILNCRFSYDNILFAGSLYKVDPDISCYAKYLKALSALGKYMYQNTVPFN